MCVVNVLGWQQQENAVVVKKHKYNHVVTTSQYSQFSLSLLSLIDVVSAAYTGTNGTGKAIFQTSYLQ